MARQQLSRAHHIACLAAVRRVHQDVVAQPHDPWRTSVLPFDPGRLVDQELERRPDAGRSCLCGDSRFRFVGGTIQTAIYRSRTGRRRGT